MHVVTELVWGTVYFVTESLKSTAVGQVISQGLAMGPEPMRVMVLGGW
jgi:hypothetical protein